MLLRLKHKSEERAAKVELNRMVKQQEEDERKSKLDSQLSESTTKFQISLDIKRVEQQRLRDDRQRKEEDRKVKKEVIQETDEIKKNRLLKKMEDSERRLEQVTARKMETV